MAKSAIIVEYTNLKQTAKLLQDQKIVVAGGCFDIFHYGHLQYLKNSKMLGDVLMVALEPDEFIIQKKHRQPIHTQNERAQILSAIRYVDYVILLPFFKKDQDYFDMVKQIRPSVISVTENDPQINNKKNQAELYGAKLVVAQNLIKHLSSSKIHYGANISGN